MSKLVTTTGISIPVFNVVRYPAVPALEIQILESQVQEIDLLKLFKTESELSTLTLMSDQEILENQYMNYSKLDTYNILNTNFNNKQNREWIYAATLSNKNTASVGVNIRNYREACIIINGHRKSGSIMIVDDVLHFIAPEAGTGTMAFMYLVKVNIVNGGFGLYVEAANRICFLESNAWLENRNWSNSFNLYIR